jgi:light-harvesting complex 1 beta chain
MGDLHRQTGSATRVKKQESYEFRLIFVVSFMIFLVAATVGRLLPTQWRAYAPGPSGYKSIIGEARAAANTFVPIVFMG